MLTGAQAFAAGSVREPWGSEGAAAVRGPTPVTACRGTVGSSRGRDLRHAESGWEGGMGTEERARPGAGRQGRERVVQQHHKVGGQVSDHMDGKLRRAAVRVSR